MWYRPCEGCAFILCIGGSIIADSGILWHVYENYKNDVRHRANRQQQPQHATNHIATIQHNCWMINIEWTLIKAFCQCHSVSARFLVRVKAKCILIIHQMLPIWKCSASAKRSLHFFICRLQLFIACWCVGCKYNTTTYRTYWLRATIDTRGTYE